MPEKTGERLRRVLNERRRAEAALREGLAQARRELVEARERGADRATLLQLRGRVRAWRRQTVFARLRTVVSTRRLANFRQRIRQPLRERALEVARGLVGVVEQGGNNVGPVVTRIIKENGGAVAEPWCGDFVAYAYRHAGSTAVLREWAAVRRLGFLTGQTITSSPKAGDIVCYDFEHTGLFMRDLGNGSIETVEGNTGSFGAVSDSTSGQDGVKLKHRPKSNVTRYVRVLR